MIFNSYLFLLFFLPLTILLFNIKILKTYRQDILITSSIIFYGYASLEHAIILAINIASVYTLTSIKNYRNSKILPTIAIAIPAFSLIYYKYLGFFVSEIISITGYKKPDNYNFSLFDNILLPAGISFFTFQLISFAIDHQKGKHDDFPSLRKFALYISFFPQLVAGPIVRFNQISNQIDKIKNFLISKKDIEKAIFYITTGLTLKVTLADTLSRTIQPIIANPDKASTIYASFTILAYSFQIYFDFYGYSLMAIGLGLLFGVRLPVNFDRPYKSKNPKEFWRRWHITLSFWIRDYLYITLGGNKSYIRNILIIFVVAGIWHGAGWNFILWGLIHGLLAAGYHWNKIFWDSAPVFLQRMVTFTIISFAWLLFLFDFDELKRFFVSLVSGFGQTDLANPTLANWSLVIASGLIAFIFDFNSAIEKSYRTKKKRIINALALSILSILSFMLIDISDSFIYFRF